MEQRTKTNQRLLQISFGVGLIFFALVIERLAVHPPGIYSYCLQGFKDFRIRDSKAEVLKKINRRKTIRAIRACEPENFFELTSRKPFVLSPELFSSNIWICRERNGKDFLFVFRQDALERVLVQRPGPQKKQGSILFTQCNPHILKDIDTYLAVRETMAVFYDTRQKERSSF